MAAVLTEAPNRKWEQPDLVTRLIDLKAPKARFARSINVERDRDGDAIDGYLPVGRAIDVIQRFATALDRDDVEVAISVTGPYGSGKSSLAVLLSALLAPRHNASRQAAEELLGSAAPEALANIQSARQKLNADQFGFIRCVATAQRESVASTVVRALTNGVAEFDPPKAQKPALAKIFKRLEDMATALDSESEENPSTRDIRNVVSALGEIAPVFLLIDEFGKNLEAFTDSKSDADLFLLQELAEWSRGGDGIPLALVTLQHMAFDEYADNATASQRREWAKIQGRFEDIPFVDSAAQTRSLISASFDLLEPSVTSALDEWSRAVSRDLANLGLLDLAQSPELLAHCWPLHPVSLLVLPELCERYGQNERTLFSFLAGHEPLSVASFLREQVWDGEVGTSLVRLDRLYDYFIESAANLVSVSANASRWIEIDMRIRDATGLSQASQRVLKTVGVLNLVSAGGALRATSSVVANVAADGREGTETAEAIAERLTELEGLGFLTFRDFADEYRIWQGSDFDLRSEVDLARRRLQDVAPDQILNQVLQMSPMIAARHSYKTGTLRAFERRWISALTTEIVPPGAADRYDGLILYMIGDSVPSDKLNQRAKPVMFVRAHGMERLLQAAREEAALTQVISTSESLGEDWVARRELLERRVESHAQLRSVFNELFQSDHAMWTWQSPDGAWMDITQTSPSALISQVCDEWYDKAPVIKNDLVNRHDLSSQAAKARRVLVEAMSSKGSQEGLGIDGFGPERTLYLSVLQEFGLHQTKDGESAFRSPSGANKTLVPVWKHLQAIFKKARSERVRVSDIYLELAMPPYGIREGIAPVIVVAALIVQAGEVALYEHGTFRPALTNDVVERLLKNPGNFEIKHYGAKSGVRSEFVAALMNEFSIRPRVQRNSEQFGSVLAVTSKFVLTMNMLPDYSRKTLSLSPRALGLRKLIATATEPDELLFNEIPKLFLREPIAPEAKISGTELALLAKQVREASLEFENAFPKLVRKMKAEVKKRIGPDCSPLQQVLGGRAKAIEGKIVDPELRHLVAALKAEIDGEEGWLEYIGLQVSGVPPRSWNDVDVNRFFVELERLGAAFRRTYALNTEMAAITEGDLIIRTTFTKPGGREMVDLIAVNKEVRAKAEPALQKVVADFAKTLGENPEVARMTLLALLADQKFD